MRHFDERPVMQRVLTSAACDGCGRRMDLVDLIQVTIIVDEHEEGGGRDEFDYCDGCLIRKAPHLVAAGSTAPLVAGYPEGSAEAGR